MMVASSSLSKYFFKVGSQPIEPQCIWRQAVTADAKLTVGVRFAGQTNGEFQHEDSQKKCAKNEQDTLKEIALQRRGSYE